MKMSVVLCLALAAASASAQLNILGVLETGEFTISVDTVTFLWSTRPTEQFELVDFGCPPNSSDTTLLESRYVDFPPSAKIDYLSDTTRMPSDTIKSLQPDVWYELPGTDSATRVKFVPQPGIEEAANGVLRTANTLPTIVRNVLFLPDATIRKLRAASLLDIAGHRVLDLRPGANDVSHLAAGVYVARLDGRTARFVKAAAD
jgi:hypothetical protein